MSRLDLGSHAHLETLILSVYKRGLRDVMPTLCSIRSQSFRSLGIIYHMTRHKWAETLNALTAIRLDMLLASPEFAKVRCMTVDIWSFDLEGRSADEWRNAILALWPMTARRKILHVGIKVKQR